MVLNFQNFIRLLSDNFVDDLEYTAQFPTNPALLKPYYLNPLDRIEKNEMQKYINTNIIDFLMIDNLLQNAKIDNAHYILHEDFRPYDKSNKNAKKLDFENDDDDDAYFYVDSGEKWEDQKPGSLPSHSRNRITEIPPNKTSKIKKI